ncbi:MAG: AAA family ATPase [Candidatus Anstonellales archaeon]
MLFQDRGVLSPHYVPDMLPNREEYVKKVVELLKPAEENKKPTNIFIYGKTGTGKTCTVKKAVSSLKVESVYVNCKIYSTKYRVMQYIAEKLGLIDKIGFGEAYLYEKLVGYLGGKQLIVVLDEVDGVKELDELIYMLTRANDEIKNGGITIVGISNNLAFKERLDPRTKSTLYQTELVFPPYDAKQIKDILMQRIELGKGKVEEVAVNIIAATAAQESGDARYALQLLSKAVDIAQSEGSESVGEKAVKEAKEGVEVDIAKELLNTLPDHAKLVMLAVIRATGRKALMAGERSVVSGEVMEEYLRVCRERGRKPKSGRWVRAYINELEMLGFITMKDTSKGLRGQSRYISLSVPKEQVIEALGVSNA